MAIETLVLSTDIEMGSPILEKNYFNGGKYQKYV